MLVKGVTGEKIVLTERYPSLNILRYVLKMRSGNDANFVVTGGTAGVVVMTYTAANYNKVGIMTNIGFLETHRPCVIRRYVSYETQNRYYWYVNKLIFFIPDLVCCLRLRLKYLDIVRYIGSCCVVVLHIVVQIRVGRCQAIIATNDPVWC